MDDMNVGKWDRVVQHRKKMAQAVQLARAFAANKLDWTNRCFLDLFSNAFLPLPQISENYYAN